MKRKLFIHVGPHKTGTTVIQKTCLDNIELLNAMGVGYPKLFFSFLGHHQLVDKVRSRAVTSDDVDALKELDQNVLLSSENYIDLSKNDWLYFSEVFSDFDVNIIYSWRKSSLKMYSIWQESIKHGETKGYYEYYYGDLVKPGVSRLLSQIINIDVLAGVFSKESLIILDYDALSEDGVLIETFFNLLGVDGQAVKVITKSDGIKNTAMLPSLTEILRSLNAYHVSLGNAKGSEVREKLFYKKEYLKTIVGDIEKLMENSFDDIRFGDYFVDKATESKIVGNYRDRIVGYKKKNRLKTLSIVDKNWLLNSDALGLLKQLYSELKLF